MIITYMLIALQLLRHFRWQQYRIVVVLLVASIELHMFSPKPFGNSPVSVLPTTSQYVSLGGVSVNLARG